MRLLQRPSPNFDERGRAIDLVILHYTGMQNGVIALERLCDPAPRAGRYAFPWETPADPDAPLGRVSAHYVVEEDGRVFALVAEEKRAWHAGAGAWRGEADLNARAIGIEIVNGGHDFGVPDFAEAQIAAVIDLVRDICARHGLRADQVVGHSDVAPARKADPGEKFPWKRLAEAGAALWPRETAHAGEGAAAAQRALAEIGYGIAATGVLDEQTARVVTAFQRRFRQERVDGVLDAQTEAMIADILAQTRALRGR
ncbi:MAG: N-acetylmuramoyl-L-alanine amidase [Hyphomonadaceae bacterium]